MRKVSALLFLLIFSCQFLTAKDFTFSGKRTLTKTEDYAEDIHASWDGKYWGLFYCIQEGGLNYLRVKRQGKILNTTPIFEGGMAAGQHTYSNIKSCWGGGGWGLILEKTTWSDTKTDTNAFVQTYQRDGLVGSSENYFYCLDEQEKPVGEPFYINGRSGGAVIWMGDFYLLYYSEPYANIMKAVKIDLKGNVIGAPSLIMDLGSGNSISVEDAIVTKKGIIVLYHVVNRQTGEQYSALVTVGLNNQTLENPIQLQTTGWPFLGHRILWTGEDYLISGNFRAQEYQYFGGFGLCDTNGAWKLFPETNGDRTDDRNSFPDIGITLGGEWLYNFYNHKRKDRCYLWGKTQDGKSERGDYEFNKYAVYFSGQAANVSSMTGIFMINDLSIKIGNQWVNKGKAYYRRFDIPHQGIPEPQFLEGKIHTAAGQKYALLSWRINGCDKIVLKGNGKTLTLPAYGWKAWPINKNVVSYRFKAKNAAGWFNKKLTVK